VIKAKYSEYFGEYLVDTMIDFFLGFFDEKRVQKNNVYLK